MKRIIASLLLGVTIIGCSTDAVKTTAAANGTIVASVNIAMANWATYTQTHTVTAAAINSVSNAYNVYYNSELLASNVLSVYAQNPTTNNATLAAQAISGIAMSQTNILNVITTLSK